MADGLRRQPLKNIIGGVSQQTPSLRSADQCEAQENCRNDPVEGMGKRFNTEWVANIANFTNPENYTYQYIDRDETERYILAVGDGEALVFDKETGFKFDVITPEWASDYLINRGNKSPQRSYQLLNTIDTTFLLNKTKPVEYLMAGEAVVVPPTEQRIVTVTVGRTPWPYNDTSGGLFNVDNYYSFTVNGTTYRYNDATASVSRVVAWLAPIIADEYPTAINIRPYSNRILITAPSGLAIDVAGRGYSDLNGQSQSSRVTTTTEQLEVLPTVTPSTPIAIWYVKQADYSTEYVLELDGTDFTIKTPDATSSQARSGLETTELAAAMALEVNQDTNYSATIYGSVIAITRVDVTDFTIKARDDLGDRASVAIKEYTEAFEDLPPNAPIDYRVEIRGSVESDSDPYHVKFTTLKDDGTNTTGFWKETVKYGLNNEIDAKTMPIALSRKQDVAYVAEGNTRGIYFELEEMTWGDRLVGDEITAPIPSFCSDKDENGLITRPRHIQSMVYYRNRLALVSDENIVFSEAGEFHNFFPTTVIALLDADVIDLSIPLNGVEPVEWCLGTNNSLFLFAPKKQLRLIGGEVFNTESIDITEISAYDTDMSVSPYTEGAFIYFWMKSAKSSQLMEYTSDGDNERWSAAQVTAHVPTYVRGQVVRTVTSSSERSMFTITRGTDGLADGTLYVHNFLWSNGSKVQNAWHTWSFSGSIIEMSIEQDVLHLLMQYEDGTVTLEKVTLSYDELKDELGYPVYLDSRTEVDSDFVLPDGDTRELVVTKGRYFVGYPYTQRYVFSEIYPRDAEGRTIRGGRLQLRYLYLNYADTTYFKITVDRKGRTSKTTTFTGRSIGSLGNILGQIPVETGPRQIRIMSRSTEAEVSITNDSPHDAVFQTVEWEGLYVNRARRT
jgi:hypothetical protein